MDPQGARWKLWAEAFRLWLPIVLSLCAISLTVFQAVSTRRHTRLSVQPRIDWRVEQDSDARSITFSLVNVGFGPAVIKEASLHFDGEALGPLGLATCAELDRRLGRDGDAWDAACVAMDGDYVLRPGDTILLYGSRPSPANAGGHPADETDVGRVSADARYCSFYDDCWRLGDS
jgi:hypothetical protein